MPPDSFVLQHERAVFPEEILDKRGSRRVRNKRSKQRHFELHHPSAGLNGVEDRRPHPAIGSTLRTLPTGPTLADFRINPEDNYCPDLPGMFP